MMPLAMPDYLHAMIGAADTPVLFAFSLLLPLTIDLYFDTDFFAASVFHGLYAMLMLRPPPALFRRRLR